MVLQRQPLIELLHDRGTLVDFDKQADEIGFVQDIVIEVGKQYTLSFVYGPRAQSSVSSDNLLSVAFGNLYEEFDAGNSVDGWQRFTQTITATDTTTRLKCLSLGKRDTFGVNVDDVSVETAVVLELYRFCMTALQIEDPPLSPPPWERGYSPPESCCPPFFQGGLGGSFQHGHL